MKKSVIALLLILTTIFVMCFSSTTTFAAESTVVQKGTCGENIQWSLDNNGVLKLTGTGGTGDFPYSEHPGWYRYAYDIKRIEIGEGITSIGWLAFDKCDNVTEIVIPKGIKEISSGAFSFYHPKKVVIGDLSSYMSAFDENCSYLSSPLYYGADLYINGSKVKELIIPEGTKSIGDGAFAGCKSIEKVIIPASVESIGLHAFYGCTNLSDVVIKGNPKVKDWAFAYCGLKSVTVSDPSAFNLNAVNYFSIVTSNHKTSSVDITVPKIPNVIKYEICHNGSHEVIATISDLTKSKYTLKKNASVSCFYLKALYDNGIDPGYVYVRSDNKDLICKPAKVLLNKVSTGSNYVRASWNYSNADGYQVQIATNSSFTKGKKTFTISDTSNTTKKITKLTKGKKYYIRVRAYRTESFYWDSNIGGDVSKKIYGSWSTPKSITCK